MVEGSWTGSGAGSVIVTDGSGADPGGPKIYGSGSGCWSGSSTLLVHYLPMCPPPRQKGTFEGRGGIKKRHTNGPRSLCRELKRQHNFCTVFCVISFLWLKVGQSDCMIVWLRAIPATSRPAKSARDCKSAFHTLFYHSTYIPLFLSSTLSFLHISCFLLCILVPQKIIEKYI